ncbi:hypothetical protein SAMN02745249_00232 [Atopostipes suicloacalis DSM 15692]|uniref:Uncharacterized protein n=1 Tax=Atopostipes suicloacalis DSM 15692 TaxID=1121025 RepID=A0A1M4SML6_9LACT|nr:hypothetical protein [Atopostipes suicloacalis]SHE33445.1 hypothetical protein SAMN02745249_00232 [Atopostipes suicloacalis DSM 15692]
MSNLPINLIFSSLFMLLILSLVIFIQLKLSRSENKFLGLILPIISFLFSLSMIIGWSSFTDTGMITEQVTTVNEETGEIIEETEEVVHQPKEKMTTDDFLEIGYLTLISNIPTIILSGIYLSEKNKMKMRKEIEKMKIDDL